MDMLDILTQLTCAPGPSGLEHQVVKLAETLLAPFVDSVKTDRMGNLLGYRFCQRAKAHTLMLDAHLDEVGFMVIGHDEGFLRLSALGGIDSRILPGAELRLLSDPPKTGVVACLPPHVQDGTRSGNTIPLEELLLDVGLSQDAALAAFPVGTRAVFIGAPFALGKKQLSGHAFDDRACFAVLLRTMELLRERPLAVNLVVCGSAQEELGARGAKTAAFAIAPESCIVVDVTHGCTPDAPRHRTFTLGGGPCIGMGPGCHRLSTSHLIETAKRNDIPFQIEVMEGNTGTNSWPIQVSGCGVATTMVSLPLKYMHTPVETLHLDDLENTAQLLAKYILSLEGTV